MDRPVRADEGTGARLCGRPTPRRGGVAILGPLVAPARLVRLTLVAVVLAALPACGVSGLSFVQDDRVDIVRPEDRSTQKLPVRVAWTVKDFESGPGKGSFGVFVDRAPQRAGKRLAWLFRGDPSCRNNETVCSTVDFLAQRNVFRTTAPRFTVEQVNRLTGASAGRQLHEVTVVLLDEQGRRVGEGAWSVQFEVEDKT